MATTPVEVYYYPGRTLTLDIYPRNSDTAAASDLTLTEQTNRKGWYRANVTGSLDGIYTLHVKENGVESRGFECDIQDTTDVCRAVAVGSAQAKLSAAYPDGYVYLDTTNGSAGTRRGENGTFNNPSNTWANTVTLMGLLNCKKAFISRNTTAVQLSADFTYSVVDGPRFFFDPNSNSLRHSVVRNAVSEGDTFGDTRNTLLEDCFINGATFGSTTNYCTLKHCMIRGTVTLNTGRFNLDNCSDGEGYSGGVSAPLTVDYNSVGSAIIVHNSNWSGEISIDNMDSGIGHYLYIYGNGTLTLNATCSNGTIVHSSGIEIVDNSGGFSGTITKVENRVEITDGTITSDTYDESTAYPLKSADSGSTAIARTGADGDTLETLSDQIDDRPTLTQMTDAFTEIKGATWSTTDTLEAIRDRGDAAWTTATGFSTHSAAEVRSEMDSNSTQIAAIVADTDELQTNQGNWLTATGFSTHSAADVRTEMDSNSTQLAAIVADTDELQTNQGDWATADVSGLATAAALATVDGNVDSILEDTGTTIPAQIGNLNNFDPANDTVANVTLVDTVTTNTDMRGTDNALLAASAPANFGDLAITVTDGYVTVGTNTDKTGYSVSGTIATLDGLNAAQDSQHSTTQSAISGLNNISEAQVNAQVDIALSDFGGPTLTQMTAAFTEIKGAGWDTTDTLEEIRDNLGGGGGGDATEAKQDEIIAAIDGLNDISASDVINYDMGNGRLVIEALAPLRNKWTISSGVYTVYDTDDSSVLWTAVSTQTAGDPTSAMDPT